MLLMPLFAFVQFLNVFRLYKYLFGWEQFCAIFEQIALYILIFLKLTLFSSEWYSCFEYKIEEKNEEEEKKNTTVEKWNNTTIEEEKSALKKKH